LDRKLWGMGLCKMHIKMPDGIGGGLKQGF
jgi:hypothetical protein